MLQVCLFWRHCHVVDLLLGLVWPDLLVAGLDDGLGIQDVEGGSMKYEQRYFFCDKFWRRDAEGKRGPIFVYVGNESDVEL